MKKSVNRHIITILILGTNALQLVAQPEKSLDQLLPLSDINTTIDKPIKQLAGIGACVNINLIASLNNYNTCATNSVSSKGLEIAIAWYNTSDETGKFMLSTLRDLDGIKQEMESFKNQTGFDIGIAKEETIEGGKLWIITQQKPCINEITGPTGVNEYSTHIRCFVFNGTAIIKIDVQSQSKPEKLREIVKKTIDAVAKFDFASVKDVQYVG
jgi:hypothetical protein